MKKIIIPISTLLVGFILGKFIFPEREVVIRSETIPIKSNSDKQLESLSSAFFNLSQKEFLEYTKLKTQKEKYEKADEILGKVMLLFLANVQMKMKTEVKDYFVHGKKTKLVDDSFVKKEPNSSPKQNKKPLLKFNEDFKRGEVIFDLPREFKSLQHRFPIEIIEPQKFFKLSDELKKLETLEKFIGSFKGEMVVVSGKRKGQIHTVELNMNFYDKDGRVDGTYESIMSYGGQKYSHNRGHGGARQVRKMKGRKGYLLETSPTSFFHLIYLSGEDYFIAKHYDNGVYQGLASIYPVR